MKKNFYIDQERMEEQMETVLDDDFDCYSQLSMFAPRKFPDHECEPVVRRRTRSEIASLIESLNYL
ncbi:MAG: hypothetical protein HFJ55_04700 [Clostridia bacterium]|nr:hypothetical protein [Clostridia bacterium]